MSSNIVEVTNLVSYHENVKSGKACVKFYSPGCPACRAFAPEWKKLAAKNKNVKFVEVNLDVATGNLGHEYEIESIPTIMFYKDDIRQKFKVIGGDVEQIQKYLSKL